MGIDWSVFRFLLVEALSLRLIEYFSPAGHIHIRTDLLVAKINGLIV